MENILITIVDSSHPDAMTISTEDGQIYITVKSCPHLNCDTYSPYLKVINGYVKNVEHIEPPRKISNKNKGTTMGWPWLNENFPREANPGDRFRYAFVIHSHPPGGVIHYNSYSCNAGDSWSYYSTYDSPQKRGDLKNPSLKKHISFYLIKDKLTFRSYPHATGISWIGQHHSHYIRTFKRPYKIIYMGSQYLHNIAQANGTRNMFGNFIVRTFRRRRKSIESCIVVAYAQNLYSRGSGVFEYIITTQKNCGYIPSDFINKYNIQM